MESTLLIIRFVLRYAANDATEAGIYARVTVRKKRAEIWTGKFIHPSQWDAQRQRVRTSRDLHATINAHLDDVEFRLRDAWHQLKKQDKIITAGLVKQVFQGEKVVHRSLLSLFRYHEETIEPMLRPGTSKNYISTRRYLLQFIREQYKTDDVLLCDLGYEFISRFDQFLRSVTPLQKGNLLCNNGIMKHMERLKKVVTLGYKLEWINKDPFILYQLKFQRFERQFLTLQELQRLHTVSLNNKRLELCRDLFLFACYTGLSYTDVVQLTRNNVVFGIDKTLWLRTYRQKTNIAVSIPLLPQAIALLERYNYKDATPKEPLLPVIANQNANQYLKKIAAACGIDKVITFHVARHTFATTITLDNGIPIETVSKLLGHSKLATTQIYTHVMEQKISRDMTLLRERLASERRDII